MSWEFVVAAIGAMAVFGFISYKASYDHARQRSANREARGRGETVGAIAQMRETATGSALFAVGIVGALAFGAIILGLLLGHPG